MEARSPDTQRGRGAVNCMSKGEISARVVSCQTNAMKKVLPQLRRIHPSQVEAKPRLSATKRAPNELAPPSPLPHTHTQTHHRAGLRVFEVSFRVHP